MLGCGNSIMLCFLLKHLLVRDINPEVFTGEMICCLEFSVKIVQQK